MIFPPPMPGMRDGKVGSSSLCWNSCSQHSSSAFQLIPCSISISSPPNSAECPNFFLQGVLEQRHLPAQVIPGKQSRESRLEVAAPGTAPTVPASHTIQTLGCQSHQSLCSAGACSHICPLSCSPGWFVAPGAPAGSCSWCLIHPHPHTAVRISQGSSPKDPPAFLCKAHVPVTLTNFVPLSVSLGSAQPFPPLPSGFSWGLESPRVPPCSPCPVCGFGCPCSSPWPGDNWC